MSSSANLVRVIVFLACLALMACEGSEPQRQEASPVKHSGAKTVVVTEPDFDAAGRYGFGRMASDEEVAGWDIDIRPDGLGLPSGEGSVEDGESLYEDQCASCHGLFGEGEGRWPKLAGGMDTLTHQRPERTVGSYWPYASTLWDYIHRAMPFTAPQSLSDDETYAITAYVLYLNDLVDDDFVLNRENFNSVKMPNEGGFFVDDRPDTSNARCMENCKDPASVEIVESLFYENQSSDEQSSDEQGKDEQGVSSDDGSTNNDAELNANTASQQSTVGQATYESACKVCHDAGLVGAPVPGDVETWQSRLGQGMEVVYRHALEGYQGSTGVMPPKGGQVHLDDESVKAAVDYMVGKKP